MRKLVATVVVMLMCAGFASAQTQTLGSIIGSVMDPSGAVISGAQVKLSSTQTGLTRTTRSNGAGQYRFLDLPVGTYSLSFSQSGFRDEQHSDVDVQGNRTVTLDVRLKTGSATETVEVQGTPLLDQEDTTNGYVLDNTTIQEIPQPDQSITAYATLSPGVNADFTPGMDTNAGLGNQNIWANGQRNQSNTFTFNSVNSDNLFNGWSSSSVGANRAVLNTGERFGSGGTIQTNTSIYDAIGQALPSPPKETIQEMRVNTSMYDASQGSTSGAQIDVHTLSGTNKYHGQIYGYRATNEFNAAPYFYNQDPSIPANDKVPQLHRAIYGATLGGPVKQNKIFFFVSYQGTHDKDELNSISSFNTAPSLVDDRSLTGIQAAAAAVGVAPNQIDPVAINILQAKVPSGYLFPTSNGGSNGYNSTIIGPPSTFMAAQANGNLDFNLSNNDVLSAKYYFQRDPTESPFSASNTLGFPQALRVGSQTFSIDNVTVVTPRLSWEQRIGFNRQSLFSTTGQALTPQSVGMNLFGSTKFPGITINDVDGNGNSFYLGPTSNFSNVAVVQNRFEGGTNLNWSIGRHTFSFGANYDYAQMNVLNKANEVASLTFNTFADFLTGNIKPGEGNSVLFAGAANRYYRAPQVGVYATDKWQLRPGLVLSVGVRYDWDAALREKNGLLVNFNPSKYSYDAGGDTIVNSGLVVAGNNSKFGTPGTSDTTLTGRQWGIAPRVGLAWSPTRLHDKMVMRAGFGIYYDRGEYFTDFSPSAGSGINGPFGVTVQPPFTQPILTTTTSLANPFGTTPPAVNFNPNAFVQNLPNIAALEGGSAPYLFGGYDPRNKLPYSENYSLDVQYEITSKTSIDIGYVGNHGLHETLPIPFNEPGIATPQNPINGQTYSYGYNKTDLEPISTYEGGNTDIRAPYIGYSVNSVYWEAAGLSHYNALQTQLHQKLTAGLLANVAYTWSHALDEGSGYGLFYNGNDPHNLRSAYGSADFDRPNVLSMQLYYQFPKAARDGSALGYVLNNWAFSSTGYLESGQPYNVYDYSGTVGSIYFSTNDYLTNPTLPLAPGVTPSQALTGYSGANPNHPAFNASAFSVPVLAPGTSGVPPCDASGCDNSETGFSNRGRNIFRGPFQRRGDVSLLKSIVVKEKYSLQGRVDVFNITNTPSFDTPNQNVTASDFNGNYDLVQGFQSGSVGLIQHTLGSPRQMEFSLHFIF